jgi:hypothetical protein
MEYENWISKTYGIKVLALNQTDAIVKMNQILTTLGHRPIGMGDAENLTK